MLFDGYVIVDWSASARPKRGKDSIWVGEGLRDDSGALREAAPINLATRDKAAAYVSARIAGAVETGRRLLVGFDFAYGYPSGFAAALRLSGSGPPWRQVWREVAALVREGPQNTNNRWDVAARFNRRVGIGCGPFWNCPASAATMHLARTKPAFPFPARCGVLLSEFRRAESALRVARPSVQSAWKLFTAGSVGSQALVGIPRLEALLTAPELASCSRVWPYETGFTAWPSPSAGPFVLHAEVWPGVLDAGALPGDLTPRDAAQVVGLVRHFAQLDEQDELRKLFDRPSSLSASEVQSCVDEEGWILGA